MLREYETNVEMMGREYAAMVRYETDPSDGYPLIDSVEIGRAVERYEERKGLVVERMSLDITRLLHDDQISALKEEIDTELLASAAAAKAERLAMEREDRGLFRRAA